GDSTFAASTSAAITQTVNKASTSLAVVSGTNPATSGQNVAFTVTIGVTAPGSGTPTGTVQFQIDGSTAGGAVNFNTSGGVTTACMSAGWVAVVTNNV